MHSGFPHHHQHPHQGASDGHAQPGPAATAAAAAAAPVTSGSDSATGNLPAPSNMVSLPPLRGLDPQGPSSVSSLYGSYHQHQHQHHYHHAGHHQQPQSPHYPLSPMQQPQPAYFQQHPYHQQTQALPLPQQQMLPQHYLPVAPPPATMRYAQIPAAPDTRALFGRSTRKEIKRRTKTGCLTCRKRRIKCDEQHPVCRNCQKSKRECAGYEASAQQSSSSKGLLSTSGGNSSAPSVSSGQQTPSPTTKEAPFSLDATHRDSVATESTASGRSGTTTPADQSDYYAGQRYGAVHPPPPYSESSQYHQQQQNRAYYPDSSSGGIHQSHLDHTYGN